MQPVLNQIQNHFNLINNYITTEWGKLTPPEKSVYKVALGVFSCLAIVYSILKLDRYYKSKKHLSQLTNQEAISINIQKALVGKSGCIEIKDRFGTTWKGNFEMKDGRMEGKGTKIFPSKNKWDGETSMHGTFKNGLLEGPGKLEDLSHIEEGIFAKGKLSSGKRSYKNNPSNPDNIPNCENNYLEGTFNSDGWLIKGKSKIGPCYREGRFESDYSLTGQGKKIWDDGLIKEGEFSNDRLHGKGKIVHPNGRIEQGRFYKGILQ